MRLIVSCIFHRC